MFKHKNIFIGLLVSCSAFCVSNTFAAENATDDVTITVPVACSMTSTVGSAHTATVDLGTYEDEIGETTFNVLCNDANGFAVYAIGYSDETYGNTTMVPSSVAAANAIATGTATSGNTSNWAMKLTAVSGDYTPTLATGFNAYHAVPDEYIKVASLASNTDAVSGSSFKSTYAVYISQAQAADTYTGKVKYTVVHPNNTTAPVAPTTMQNLSSASCTSAPSQVVDNRDNHTYIIQRLLDGNCWMMENLDLGHTDLVTDLTSTNTNLATTITASTFNGWKKTTGTRSFNSGEFIPLTSSNTSNGLEIDPTSGTAYGTLYNYYAASAGTISGSNNSNNASYDICPAGWRLPTGGPSGELQILSNQYSSLLTAPIESSGASFTQAGQFQNLAPTGQGSYGYYWSSTQANGEENSVLQTTATKAPPVFARCNGFSIRCLLKE